MVDKAKSPNAHDNKRGSALRTGGLATTSSSNLLNRPAADNRSGRTSELTGTFGVGSGGNNQSPGRRIVGAPKEDGLYKVESRSSLGRQSNSTYS